MDPDQTLKDGEAYVLSKEFGNAVQRLATYYQWRLKGGFEPINGDMRAATLTTHITDALDAVDVE